MNKLFSPDKEQQEAITAGAGPVLVLAGPGSGKTSVITERLIWLIEKEGIKASRILAITFTKAAADEMRQRFLLWGRSSNRESPVISTFHSLFYYILRSEGITRRLRLADEEIRQGILVKTLKARGMDEDIIYDFSLEILSEISRLKNGAKKGDMGLSGIISTEDMEGILEEYSSGLRDAGLLEYDDMMLLTKKLFEDRREVLFKWQGRFKYILVDEFQDISPLQYELVCMLGEPEKNLFVVGDDDQSVYGFRAAGPGLMRRFERDFSEHRKIILSNNYRSQSNIVRSARAVIENNKSRLRKDMKSRRKRGVPVRICAFGSTRDELFTLQREIMEKIACGIEPKEIAVLFRFNSLAGRYAPVLGNTGIVLSTMHRAKGLEFETVYIVDANEGIIPYDSALKGKELEEERRVFYVAMTRAKDELNIFYVSKRRGREFKPSRFISEISKKKGR